MRRRGSLWKNSGGAGGENGGMEERVVALYVGGICYGMLKGVFFLIVGGGCRM